MAIQPKELERVENTVVGESILIDGKLEGDEDLIVRGRVHGSITLTKTLIIEPTGVVKADAVVRNAIVSGVVVGNLSASESVQLTQECRMIGDINAPRVIIVEGAAFRGRIDMGEVAAPVLEPRQQPAVPVRPAVPAAPVRSSLPARPAMPVRPAFATARPTPPTMPARPPSPPRPPPPAAVRPAPRPVEPAAKPPPPPPPPPPAAAKASAPEMAPMAAGIAKRKVVVKRKK